MVIEGYNELDMLSESQVEFASNKFRRLLYYLPNTTGVGHESRAIAVLTGLRSYLKKTEFLIVSSTKVPQEFLRHNLELVRLPTLSNISTDNRQEMTPRYLNNSNLADVLILRQSLLNTVFTSYRPDLLMIDHHPIGLEGEILPWLLHKRIAPNEFVTTYISRGIIAKPAFIRPPYQRSQRGVDQISVGDLYDRFYVLESFDRLSPEIRNTYTKSNFANRVRFLDRVTVKTKAELISSSDVSKIYQLPTDRLITANLGHNTLTSSLIEAVVKGFTLLNTDQSMTLLIVLSPNVDSHTISHIQSRLASDRVIIRGFIPDLVDILNVSAVAICRAGYNTVAELDLTGCPALIIPEDYGSQEQVLRIGSLSKSAYSVLMPELITPKRIAEALKKMLQEPRRNPYLINKYRVSQLLLADLLTLEL